MALKPCQGCGKQVDTTAPTCPGCGRPKPTVAPLSIKQGLIGFGVLFVVGVMFCGKLASNSGGGASNSGVAPAAAVAPPPAAPPPKPIAITAVQLHRAYSDNEVAADAKYRGKPLLVDGIVDSIDKNFADDIVLHLRSGDSFNFVMATMKDSQASAAAELKKRQRVEVLCKGSTRVMGSATLDDCEISATWK